MTLDDLEPLIKLARDEGALHVEVLREAVVGHRVVRSAGSGRSDASTFGHDQTTIRVWVEGGRVGSLAGPTSSASDLVGQALASTFESPEDPFAGPVGRLDTPSTALSIRDRRHDRIDAEAREEVVADVRQQLRADRRFTGGPVLYEDVLRHRQLVSSKGLRFDEEDTTFHLETSITGKGLELHQHTTSRSFASVASLPLGVNLLTRAEALLQAGKTLPGGPTRVVLTPLAMSRLLVALGERFTPERVATDGLIGGGRRFSEKLHLVDDGGLAGGLRSATFDDRGVPPVPLTLLREGEVAGRFLTPERARQLGTRPTGHVWGGRLRSANLVMREGTRSWNALLTELGGPSLLVDDLFDLSGLDLATGALDLRVDGVVMDANQPVGAMRGVRLVGDLADLLSNIVHVCNNTDRIGHVDAAAIIADGLELVV